MTDYYKDTEEYVPPRAYTHRFTHEEVKQVRLTHGIGLVEAKWVLMREQILEDLKKGKCGLETGLLYDILIYLIETDKIGYRG